MEFHGVKQTDSAKLKFAPGIAESIASWIKSLKDGQDVRLTMTKVRSKRTDRQLKTIWGFLLPIAMDAFNQAGIDCMGVPLSRDMAKKILYHYCAGVGESGETVTLSDQDIPECMEFFERCRNWLAEAFKVVVPDPNIFWKNSVVSDGAADKDENSPHGTDATHAPSEATAEPVGAKEDKEGPTEPKDGHPAPVWSEENQRYPHVCEQCGIGYRIVPDSKQCNNKVNGYRCRGRIVER